jgi:hypothetical protein
VIFNSYFEEALISGTEPLEVLGGGIVPPSRVSNFDTIHELKTSMT